MPALAPVAPGWTLPRGTGAPGRNAGELLTLQSDTVPPRVDRPAGPPSSRNVRRTLWLGALAAWAAGAALVAGATLRALVRLRRLSRRARAVTGGPLLRLADTIARAQGVRRYRVLLGGESAPVATWGWRRPAILLPRAAPGWPR